MWLFLILSKTLAVTVVLTTMWYFVYSGSVLSGQEISKGQIKAIAHAKDGDCFGCLIIPHNNSKHRVVSKFGMLVLTAVNTCTV